MSMPDRLKKPKTAMKFRGSPVASKTHGDPDDGQGQAQKDNDGLAHGVEHHQHNEHHHKVVKRHIGEHGLVGLLGILILAAPFQRYPLGQFKRFDLGDAGGPAGLAAVPLMGSQITSMLRIRSLRLLIIPSSHSTP
jgi:hypothetical protein